jgi:hypothetical protein
LLLSVSVTLANGLAVLTLFPGGQLYPIVAHQPTGKKTGPELLLKAKAVGELPDTG